MVTFNLIEVIEDGKAKGLERLYFIWCEIIYGLKIRNQITIDTQERTFLTKWHPQKLEIPYNLKFSHYIHTTLREMDSQMLVGLQYVHMHRCMLTEAHFAHPT